MKVSKGRLTAIHAALMAGSVMLPTGAAFAQDGQEAASVQAAQTSADQGAQDQESRIGDIVVTAQRRAENVQKIPVAVSVATGDELEKMGVRSVMDLGRTMSSVDIAAGNGLANPRIRGLQGGNVFLGAVTEVAMYIDGVYFSRFPQGAFALSNIDRVEVLKGPQGTLFGLNSNGGVISIVTKDPSHDPKARGSISYDNYNIVEGDLYLSTGLTSNLAMDVSISGRNQGDGYGRNVTTGTDARYSHYFTAKTKVLFTPTDTTRITLGGMYAFSKADVQAGTYPFGYLAGYLTAPFTARTRLPGYYDIDNDVADAGARSNTWSGSLKIEQELSFANFTTTSAYLTVKEQSIFDGDFGPRPDYYLRFPAHLNQFTQELQLSSLTGSDLTWVAGLFYYRNLSAYDNTLQTTPSGQFAGIPPVGVLIDSEMVQKSYSAYAQATYEIFPRLKLTGGLRYTIDKYRASGTIALNTPTPFVISAPTPNSASTKKPTYKIALDFAPSDGILLYGSYAKGVKAGVFNIFPYTSDPLLPESLVAYELGFKTTLLDRRLRINGAVFQYDYNNLLTRRDAGNGTFIAENSGSARSRGAEIEIEARPTEGLSARLGINYVDAKFVNNPVQSVTRPNPVSPFGPVTVLINASGKTRPLPPVTLTAALDYSFTNQLGQWFMGIDYRYVSSSWRTEENVDKVEGYGVANANVRYMPKEQLSISAWVKNITGKKYASLISAQGSNFPLIPGAPRTYGLTIGFDF